MPSFQLPEYTKTTSHDVKVSRALVPVITRFRIPNSFRETMPLEELNELEADLLMNYYLLPQAGELIEYKDRHWIVTGVTHRPSRRHSKDTRWIPHIRAEYQGIYVDDDSIES